MKLNTDKCYVLLNSQRPNTIKIGNLCIKDSSCETMLGKNLDYKLKFTNHIDEIWKKASRKLNALARILRDYVWHGFDLDDHQFHWLWWW